MQAEPGEAAMERSESQGLEQVDSIHIPIEEQVDRHNIADCYFFQELESKLGKVDAIAW